MDDVLDYSHILDIISSCRDVDKLTIFTVNAQRKNVPEVRDAALKQLNALLPVYQDGSFEFAFWKMFATYHKTLLVNGRPTYRLEKARQAALDEGEEIVLTYWVKSAEQAWAFDHLVASGLADITAENVVLRFPKKFSLKLKEQAKTRLRSNGQSVKETT